MPKTLIHKIQSFTPKKIAVIGDLVLDKYTIGKADRLSQEAPVPILTVTEETHNAGGAGNTAVNIQTLGSIPYLIGIIGKDEASESFIESLAKYGVSYNGIFKSQYSRTITKERVVCNQQMLRIDRNDKIAHNQEHYDFMAPEVLRAVKENDIFVISDYGKGTLSTEFIKEIITLCNSKQKTVIVDPRPKNKDAYHNATFITPNFNEAYEMSKEEISREKDNVLEDAFTLGLSLKRDLNSSVILTLSENGICFIPRYKPEHEIYRTVTTHYPTYPRQVRDVSGAGDTVVAALAVGLANNLSIEESIMFANHAAGVKVQKSGVQPVSLDEVVEDIRFHNGLK
jgi:D-beta-D-heptose 7-phosphate kinase/D-beta-D-heptose 1-phosphate adenosyltransferase